MVKYPVKINLWLNIIIAIGTIIICSYAFFLTSSKIKSNYLEEYRFKNVNPFKSSYKKPNDYNVWLIFTKVNNRSSLKYKFRDLLYNLLNVTSLPLKFNIIVDQNSKEIASNVISDVVFNTNQTITYIFYDVVECALKIEDIVSVLTPHFSYPGTYYSDVLFYISLGLYRIAPLAQEKAILLDCDLYFKKDVVLLFDEFKRFKPTALFGLAPELTPVYRHILHTYKAKHNTTFGEYYHSKNVSKTFHPRGFQGYNSGVVLIDFKAQRNSTEFPKIITNASVEQMTSKYKFRGHLGDQDFYTLMGYEYPHLIQTLNCGLNRQLCTWWRDHGYSDIFGYYAKCDHPTVVLHGNCNTKIPK